MPWDKQGMLQLTVVLWQLSIESAKSTRAFFHTQPKWSWRTKWPNVRTKMCKFYTINSCFTMWCKSGQHDTESLKMCSNVLECNSDQKTWVIFTNDRPGFLSEVWWSPWGECERSVLGVWTTWPWPRHSWNELGPACHPVEDWGESCKTACVRWSTQLSSWTSAAQGPASGHPFRFILLTTFSHF